MIVHVAQRSIGLTVLVLSAALASGCNSSSNNPPQCTPPNGIRTVLVYPAPGATGIPDNVGVVVFGSTSALPSSFDAFIVNNTTGNSGYYNLLGVPPNPLPSPAATPSFASPVYQSSGNPGITWFAGSSLTMYLNDTGSNCVPTLNLGTIRVL
jgi:hypothetical protein